MLIDFRRRRPFRQEKMLSHMPQCAEFTQVPIEQIANLRDEVIGDLGRPIAFHVEALQVERLSADGIGQRSRLVQQNSGEIDGVLRRPVTHVATTLVCLTSH